MENLVGNWIGLVHLMAALISTITGTVILIGKKGTRLHRRIGLVYVTAMTLTNLSAFLIYRLTGSFGPFHIAAVISLLTVFSGMIPIWLKRPVKHWRYFHLSFSYWSVIGLYMSVLAETLTRIPSTPFFTMVGIAMATVMIFGIIYFIKKQEEWKNQIGIK